MASRADYGLKERRGHFRIRTILPATYRSHGHWRRKQGTTSDLSLNGAAIETFHPHTPGELLEISIALGSKLILCRAKIVHVERLRGKRYRAGLQFQELSDEGRRLLRDHLYHLINRRKKRHEKARTPWVQTNGSSPHTRPRTDGKRAVLFLDEHRIRPESIQKLT